VTGDLHHSDSDPGGPRIGVQVDTTEAPPHADRVSVEAIEALVRFVLDRAAISVADVDIVLCGDERMAELNRSWLDREGATDVISFDLATAEGVIATKGGLEGEIYVDLSQADRQAPAFDATVDEELRRLVIHGVLHLIGFDDASPEVADRMKQRQEELVTAWDQPLLSGEPS